MLPKTAEYALRAAICLGCDNGHLTSADDLAKATKVPRRYLHAVMQDLVRAKLARSRSGRRGGYTLARGPDKITIMDVINAVVPQERIGQRPDGSPSPMFLCPLHKLLNGLFAVVEDRLEHVTVAKMLNSTSSIVPLRDGKEMPKSRPLLFACSGCSHAGRLAYDLAQELSRLGLAEMSCLAGIGARKARFLKQLRDRETWVVDGCPIECARGVFEQADAHVDVHARLHDLGVRKNSPSQADCDMDGLVGAVLKQISSQRARTQSH